MIYIFCAPSGSGKSTMVNHLLTCHPDLFELSISCTTRAPRGQEVHGREYYFVTVDEFQQRIANDEFIEFEQVYEGLYYGTLKDEIRRIEQAGRQVLLTWMSRVASTSSVSWVIAPPRSLSVRPLSTNCVADSRDVATPRPR